MNFHERTFVPICYFRVHLELDDKIGLLLQFHIISYSTVIVRFAGIVNGIESVLLI